jgi:hypothetical protein
MIDADWLREFRAALNALRSMPEWQRDLVRNVDTDLVRAIVADHRHPIHPAQDPRAKVSVHGAGVVKTGDVGPQHRPVDASATNSGGWQEPPKVDAWRPPGIEHMDRMMDQQDAIDRAARVRELAGAAAVQRALNAAEPKEQEPKARSDKKA